jgi:hypothetical protein
LGDVGEHEVTWMRSGLIDWRMSPCFLKGLLKRRDGLVISGMGFSLAVDLEDGLNRLRSDALVSVILVGVMS